MASTFYRPASEPTRRGTREDTRESLARSRHVTLTDPAEAVADLIEWTCHRNGGAKALSGGALPISYPQIRRMAGDGDIPNLRQILEFVRLAGPGDPFRPALIAHLEHMFDPEPLDPEQLVAAVEDRLKGKRVTAAGAGQAVREALLLPFEGPGAGARR